MKRYLLPLLVLFSTPGFAATLNLSQTPLFLTDSVAPLTLFVVSRDHKLYFEAYDDASDIDGDGVIDIQFKPSISYYGYFDSKKCYSYDSSGQYFYPTSVTQTGTCPGTWSGNFLNYLTMSRLDALRKVLYGGYRSTDSTSTTILERSYIPQDAHSWGKEYRSLFVNGYNISDYTPFSAPTYSTYYHLFANTTLRNSTNVPLLRVALNQPYRIWEWVSIEKPVAGSRVQNGSTGPTISGVTNYVVRVKVCDSNVGLEENCRTYPNSSTKKPIGLLQEFGENNSMYFGLLTGSYNNNLQGGVLRKNISSIVDEIDLSTGQFTSVNGIIGTLNRLTVSGFQTDYNYDCGLIVTRNIVNGECQMWGNPLAEMVYEAVRYFAGKASPTPSFDYSGGTDSTLGLAKPTWVNPYSQYPRCSKANIVVVSDLPSYDSDQVPGNSFTSFSGDLTPSLNASSLGQQIFSGEGLTSSSYFIGQSGSVANGAPTPKTVSSFGNIRGLAPYEANSQGSYNLADVTYYGYINDVNSASGKQNIKSFMVSLSAPAPQITLKVGNKPITIIPFAKSVKGLSIDATQGAYQPTNNTVDFYFESLTDTSAVFRVNFEDVQQGSDFDMDAIVRYTVNVDSDSSLSVTIQNLSAAGSITQHLGYIISGTTADGVYLEIRDVDTASYNDIDYFLDTPPGKKPGEAWQDNLALPTSATRTFSPSSLPSANLLESPLWYAAKWGGFNDLNKNNIPDQTREFDASNSGNPDNHFFVTNANNLKAQLGKALSQILERVGSFSSAALSSGFLETETQIYQAIFRTTDWSGQLLAFGIDPVTGDILTNGNGSAGAVWDAAQQLNLVNFNTGRNIITYKPSLNKGIPFRWPSLPASPSSNELDASQITLLNTNPINAVLDNLGSLRLNYLRGSKSSEVKNGGTFRNRSTLLGDIINSNPIAVGIPEQQYPAYWGDSEPENSNPYSSFRQNNLNRKSVIYVGANDGALHAFDSSTGDELLAYIPSAIYSKLNLLSSDTYSHNYFVDGSPTVIDVFINNQWRTIISGGLNGGGQGVYALDVTNPGTFSEGNASSIVKWEFTDANDIDLGFTYSQPSIVRLANGEWAAIFGNGYNNTYSDGRVSSTGNAVLYIVNISTGAIIKKFNTGVGMSADPLNLARPNGMSTPTVVDSDGNFIADLIYVGDLFGNVWKIDISSSNTSQWDFSFKSGSSPVPFFVATDANGKRQAITSKISVSRIANSATGLQIYVGTGRYIENADKTDTSLQTVYALRDDSATTISGRAFLRQQTIIEEAGDVRVTSNNQLSNNDRGWYLDLAVNGVLKGERIISNMIYLDKKLIFSTIIPTSDPCDFGGESWLMTLDAFTGARLINPVLDADNSGTVDTNDTVAIVEAGNTVNVAVSGIKSQVGLISTPAIAHIADGAIAYMAGTSGEIQKTTLDLGTTRMGRQSWRQLQ
ncbi:type IV fimbrial biogenesis PilY1-like protein (plasmid) [Legionella adelaidensis]|uniref:Type IV fimbrial biogenesis PilY1-like protein n=1 Tax=Legionella adelaidensis TaxID=45056 RepID=A0A0W0R385_9GAMM|nr:PilC/PilY family type IV pilus protein [Legionella adelaidensis]KTC65511.1 type IV fimbrial biogenesis PilY1-like protein [Legionella adelaidensis]VEH84668.1 type IV fimbrial biogenesis PilY1-like protein [Legionella adelaidensis]